jgi:hypothetical protein
MTLEQLIKEVDRLDDQQFKRLLEHIEQRRRQVWGRAFDEVVAALREGLTPEQVDEMVQAMHAEYIKPVDDSKWQD